MPGPAPKPAGTRQRRNATVPMVALPAGGHTGETPPWPLVADLDLKAKRLALVGKEDMLLSALEESDSIKTRQRTEREMDQVRAQIELIDQKLSFQADLEVSMWTELWRTPQAEMWEKLAWHRDVAQYVRWKVRAELGDLESAKEARMWSDRLGLNPLAMLRLRWEIERAAAAEDQGQRRRAASRKSETKPEDPRGGLYAV